MMSPVPVEIDGAFTAEQYGTNGFWLTFDNINNVGEDSAPIGATGHTVARNFEVLVLIPCLLVTLVRTLLHQLQEPIKQMLPRTLAVLSPGQAFNGDLSNQAQANASAAWIYWTTNLNCNTVTLIVNNDTDQTANTTRINGTEVVTPAATLVGSNFEQTFNVAGGTLTEFAFMNQGGPNTSIFGMRINGGQVLEDNDGTGFDPMTDSPTQNFGTWNAVYRPMADTNATGTWPYNNGNLVAGPGGSDTDATSGTIQKLNEDDTYFEFQVLQTDNQIRMIWAPQDEVPFSGITPMFQVNSATQWQCFNQNGTSPLTQNVTLADVTFGVRVDAANGNVEIFRDGASQATLTGWDNEPWWDTEPCSWSVTSNGFPQNMQVRVNYGQQPYEFRPNNVNDDNNVQTNNLPDAPIVNGRDHLKNIDLEDVIQLFSSQSRDETLGIADFTEQGPCPGSTVQLAIYP